MSEAQILAKALGEASEKKSENTEIDNRTALRILIKLIALESLADQIKRADNTEL